MRLVIQSILFLLLRYRCERFSYHRLVTEVLFITSGKFLACITVGLRTVVLDGIYSSQRSHSTRPLYIKSRLKGINQSAQISVPRTHRVGDTARLRGWNRGYFIAGHDY